MPVAELTVPRMQSPCVKICVIDEGSGYCLGCNRTLDEITRWSQFTAKERQRIMAELPDRRGTTAERGVR